MNPPANNTLGYWFHWGCNILYQAALEIDQFNAQHSLPPITQTPKLDAEYLLLASAKISKIDLLVYPEKIVSQDSITRFQNYIERRKKGEPVAFILGYQPFWNLNLLVSPDTLIPRVETELLVEIILEKVGHDNNDKIFKVLDLGTGTGAIALALAKECPQWSIVATDTKPSIIDLAQKNAKINHIVLNPPGQLIFRLGSWFDALDLKDTKFSVIVSNPPYIPQTDPHLEQPNLLFEPLSALASGPQGLDALAHIIQNAPRFLKKDGLLLLEHGYDQKQAVQHLFHKAGFKDIETRVDLAGLDRATFGWWL